MTNDQYSELIAEVKAIRIALLAKTSDAPQAKPQPRSEVPMPTEIIENASDVLVHFGKNLGTRLGDLAPKSVEWYAQEPELRLRKDGTPFPPRAEDLLLRNAARTIVHRRSGKLAAPANEPVLQSAPINEDQVPF